MRDYPNMSYCMTSNTLLALNQVLEVLRDKDSAKEFFGDMDDRELWAFSQLRAACEDFVTACEQADDEAAQDLLDEVQFKQSC